VLDDNTGSKYMTAFMVLERKEKNWKTAQAGTSGSAVSGQDGDIALIDWLDDVDPVINAAAGTIERWIEESDEVEAGGRG
jgi:hypothetical protein